MTKHMNNKLIFKNCLGILRVKLVFCLISLKSMKITEFDVGIDRLKRFSTGFDGVWLSMDRFSPIFVEHTLMFGVVSSKQKLIKQNIIKL